MAEENFCSSCAKIIAIDLSTLIDQPYSRQLINYADRKTTGVQRANINGGGIALLNWEKMCFVKKDPTSSLNCSTAELPNGENVVDTIFPQTEAANKNDDDVSFYAETKDNFKHLLVLKRLDISIIKEKTNLNIENQNIEQNEGWLNMQGNKLADVTLEAKSDILNPYSSIAHEPAQYTHASQTADLT
ncbi:hypothetical protein WN51_03431 [Melipona quadrifasciata]|uniref:Uncharacterized protein n=1 Tax=Melipona quadrifasciata TaxID=166423 RepID=A0A0M9ADL8_9HYME|nr:hypothetical protein WN51_03431 [Melipona quadrifasciata]